MGCGASKESSVLQTTIPKDEKKESIVFSEKEILPGIKGKESKAAVCFEIPLEDLSCNTLNSLSKNSLPKLTEDVSSKLANTEERWKELENKKSIRKKGDKPILSSSKKDAADLAKKLEEKENQAAMNRIKEKEKLAKKIAAQEQRARLVLERKKQINQDDERFSVGGENESSSSQRSSDQSCSDSASSRGSSNSLETETTDVDDRDESSVSCESSPEPIKKFKNTRGNERKTPITL